MDFEELALKFWKRSSVSTELVSREMSLAGDMLVGAARNIAQTTFKKRRPYLEEHIVSHVTESARLIRLTLGTEGVPYGAAQEYGALISIPEYFGRIMKFINPRTGDLVFTKHRKAYQVILPERSYIRKAIQENYDEILMRLDDAMLRNF